MTMAAPTAKQVLKALARRQFANGIAALGSLQDEDAERVGAVLARISPASRVDVGVLISEVRAERARAEASASASAWRYALLNMTYEELVEFKRLLLAGTDPNEAVRLAGTSATGRVRVRGSSRSAAPPTRRPRSRAPGRPGASPEPV